MERITPLQIKKLVEKISNIKNLETKSRKEVYVYLRYVCYRLCKDFIAKEYASLSFIGESFGDRDHSSVLHGLNEFDKIKTNKSFKFFLSIYLESKEHLLINFPLYDVELRHNKLTLQEYKAEVKIRYTKLSAENDERIYKYIKENEDLKSRIKNISAIKGRGVFDKLTLLSKKNLDEFEFVVDNFLKSLDWKRKLETQIANSKRNKISIN